MICDELSVRAECAGNEVTSLASPFNERETRLPWRRRLQPLGLAIALFAPALEAPAGEPPPPPEVRFTLSEAEGRRGSVVTLELGVYTEAPLRSLSISLNFDESAVRCLEVRRSFREDLAPGADLRSIHIDNRDTEAGDQAGEGWIYIELSSPAPAAPVDLPAAEAAQIFELVFAILPEAPLGFSSVRFEEIGPVELVNRSGTLTNSVELAGAAPEPLRVAVEDQVHGGINIIGEVGFFLRGDVDMNCRRDVGDPVLLLSYLFLGASEPPCLDAADANDSGVLDLADAIFILQWLYLDGPGFSVPYEKLGEDPTEDALDCAFGFPSPASCGGAGAALR
jgi:hypothetical protein